MSEIKVDPAQLEYPVNVIRRGADIIEGVAGAFRSQAGLTAAQIGDPAAGAQVAEAFNLVSAAMPTVANGLVVMSEALAQAAGGYVKADALSAWTEMDFIHPNVPRYVIVTNGPGQ